MIKTLEIRVYFHSWIQAAYHYQSCLLYSIQFFFPRLARHEVQLEQQLGLYIWQVRIIILSLIKMERMKLQCFGVTSEEIRYRRIGNERRIPFAFWPDSQECLHRTRLIVSQHQPGSLLPSDFPLSSRSLLFMPSLTTRPRRSFHPSTSTAAMHNVTKILKNVQ